MRLLIISKLHKFYCECIFKLFNKFAKLSKNFTKFQAHFKKYYHFNRNF